MRTYQYRGFDARGRPCRGLVESASAKGAREKLAGQGILAERVVPGSGSSRFPRSERSLIYRELASLLRAGLPVVRALDILVDSPEMSGTRVLVAGVRDRIKEGASLAAALQSLGRSVTPFEVAILETAERSATVAPMLDRLAGVLEDQETLKARVQSALFYPAIVTGLGVCVAIVMLGLLLPRTRALFAQGGMDLPGLTRAMLGLGSFLGFWGLPILAAGAAAAFAVRARMRRDAAFREALDLRLFSLPLAGRAYRLLACLRFARTLSVLAEGGVSLIDGLAMAGRATGSIWLARAAAEQAESVRHGGRLSEAVARIAPLAETLPGWIRIGEEGGGLAALLENAGARYQAQWDRFIARCLSLLEPVLVILIGGFVLMVTLSVLLPVLDLSRAVGK